MGYIMDNWKPSHNVLKTWGSSNQWEGKYIEWIRDNFQDSVMMIPPIGSIHPLYANLWNLARHFLNACDEDRKAFLEGKMNFFGMSESYNPYNPYNYSPVSGFEIAIKEALEYNGAVTPEIIEQWVDKFMKVVPYPMAS
jgi:hypothetical protein